MTKQNTQQVADLPARRPDGKKTYLKPSFRHERVFETMALACGKVFATQGACIVNRKNS